MGKQNVSDWSFYQTTEHLFWTIFHARFYMPHGLSVDTEGNLWLTDVAMHQVKPFERKVQFDIVVLGI